MTLQSDLDRGQKAERLVKDPMLAEAFELVRQAIHDQWENAPIRDHDGAHELKLMLKLLGDVRANLEHAIADGKIAALELQRQNSRTQQ
jgi:hypothetical protein